jgi:hypothetical protein
VPCTRPTPGSGSGSVVFSNAAVGRLIDVAIVRTRLNQQYPAPATSAEEVPSHRCDGRLHLKSSHAPGPRQSATSRRIHDRPQSPIPAACCPAPSRERSSGRHVAPHCTLFLLGMVQGLPSRLVARVLPSPPAEMPLRRLRDRSTSSVRPLPHCEQVSQSAFTPRSRIVRHPCARP